MIGSLGRKEASNDRYSDLGQGLQRAYTAGLDTWTSAGITGLDRIKPRGILETVIAKQRGRNCQPMASQSQRLCRNNPCALEPCICLEASFSTDGLCLQRTRSTGEHLHQPNGLTSISVQKVVLGGKDEHWRKCLLMIQFAELIGTMENSYNYIVAQ